MAETVGFLAGDSEQWRTGAALVSADRCRFSDPLVIFLHAVGAERCLSG